MFLVLLGPLILVLLGPLNFSSAGTINFSSAGFFLYLNAISSAFSSAGTIFPLGPLILVLLKCP